MAINNASGIIKIPPLTKIENKDSLAAAEDVPIPVLSTCNKILNMKCRF